MNILSAIGIVNPIDRHYRLLNRIRSEKSEKRLIQLCKKDISIAHSFNRAYRKKAAEEANRIKMTKAERKRYVALPKSYPAFVKLAVIYERNKDYSKAITVCRKAIQAGYPDDDTQGGMKARIERLKEKKGAR